MILEGDEVQVRIVVKEINQTNLDALASLGIKIIYIPSDGDTLYAWVPIPKIRDLGEQEFIEVIYPEARPLPQ
ncbi:hypothetical protein ANME2D_00745 [Candidatus Methanoperedens nitroreducens]|uniref:Uncharacterized protein n=1 Tax=Candidatus Methanoperedens nitratireducens TaxID=1392998 RepID=A0A062V8P6_9EURY|nr:hypothetical protein [Candidatus Methanoperedens nitroreducens]KCZ73672.1 hypothetical protein ANME2D_00745 [Candidatus Methanoperedens nitroreducens]MDJ1422368.1 hypothetical protein [Candidatus Methanoperedens sp.]